MAHINTPEGKREFITNLCDNVRDEMISKIAKMPEEWDGHELRELLSAKFEYERGRLLSDKRSRRYKDFRANVYNLLL